MNILAFIEAMLTVVWVIVGLSILTLLLGWFIGGLLARWADAALRRISVFRLLLLRLEGSDEDRFRLWIRRIVRTLVTLIAIWGAWQILNTSTAISGSIALTRQWLLEFARLSAVHTIFDLGVIAAATYVLFKGFGWIRIGFDSLRRRIDAERGKRLRAVRFQRVQLLTAGQLTALVRNVSKYLHYAVNILLIFIYLTGVFSVFPRTRGLVTGILQDVFQSVGDGWQGFLSYLPSLLNLLIIILITHYSLKVIRFVFDEVQKGTISFAGFHPDWAIPTFQLVRFVAIALALVIAFPFLPGSSSPAFQGISIFIGFLLSLGSSSVVANIVSGVVLTYTRAFRTGDRVKIADTVGDVIEKTLLVTRIRTIKNVEVTIPNSLVLQSHMINYSATAQQRGLILNTTIALGYDIPWRRVHEVLIKAASVTDGILATPAPFVLQTSLDDSYVSYELNAYTDKPNAMAVIYSDLHQNVQDSCNEAGIEILSPQFGAIRDGNRSTIPPEHLPKDYVPPPFRVRTEEEQK
jgi:small-conductance mechanosensitive channel